jgi:hypothetical protein
LQKRSQITAGVRAAMKEFQNKPTFKVFFSILVTSDWPDNKNGDEYVVFKHLLEWPLAEILMDEGMFICLLVYK